MIRNMKKAFGNKGLTLVELVVAFAILAVIMLTVTLVIGTSSNTYTKIATDINLQYESQLAMSQLQEYVIDCDACVGISSGGGSLYIINKAEASHYDVYKFSKKTDSDALYFYKTTADNFDPADPDFSEIAFDSGELMSSYVKGFSAAVATLDDAASSVTITIDYGLGGETYNGRQTFALRNQVPISLSVPAG